MFYHSSLLGEGIGQANIYRWLDCYPGTLILDEADFTHTDANTLITQIMNGGYDRTGGVTRSEATDQGYQPRFFSSFGPKVVAARRPYLDNALESRFLTQVAHDKTRDIPLTIPNFMEWDEMIAFRNRLLGFRLEYLHKIDVSAKVR